MKRASSLHGPPALTSGDPSGNVPETMFRVDRWDLFIAPERVSVLKGSRLAEMIWLVGFVARDAET